MTAFTPSGFDPPYFNVSEEDDFVVITVRGTMNDRMKCYHCGGVPHNQPQAEIKLTKEEWAQVVSEINGGPRA